MITEREHLEENDIKVLLWDDRLRCTQSHLKDEILVSTIKDDTPSTKLMIEASLGSEATLENIESWSTFQPDFGLGGNVTKIRLFQTAARSNWTFLRFQLISEQLARQ